MNLSLHLLIHFLFAVFAGYIVWKLWHKPKASFFSAIAGGIFIDLDHLIDYFLAFGLNFNLDHFLGSHQYLKTDKVYILFHGWEYIIFLLIVVLILKNKTIKSVFLALVVGAFFHLSTDIVINEAFVKTYSVVYRFKNGFEAEKLILPEQYKNHLIRKKLLNL
ncbi:MAG: hypothetical protein A3D75_01630 [Candidatus Levybacteria bacterium RIFCSPHIGHO2_02_FULL_37_18]|nr:MAG: hypothetical protein A2794_01855 [Alphaproteobacteria bacterium RIFCSPHIGHO2_01_FULL_40_8]OGH21687.1 MAG: hypothetical protein A3D75_01630 [Candidatus Levybacteria bacterium RIFCSPHIGHO2_02_FULL_37_18]OGH33259.1 MAG: hypothetical protein A3A47_02990 [Candidatus Levybacteria bacterium RIFCSPLOWO2_01_FULL_37_20]